MKEQEIWKPISGYERYAVSNFGRVRNNASGKILSARKGGIKYENPTVLHVHRLVAEAFLPVIEGKNCVNHIDGDKANNHLNNLEWVTNKENTAHAIQNGLMNPNYSEMNRRSRKASNAAHNTESYREKMQKINQNLGRTKVVQQIDIATGKLLHEYLNCYEAARRLFGEGTTNDRLISRCARGKCKSAYGFVWKYKANE